MRCEEGNISRFVRLKKSEKTMEKKRFYGDYDKIFINEINHTGG
jgi:hypothetical protein